MVERASSFHPLQPLDCIYLADGVCQTLFDDFADHQKTVRGEEEIGWVLLGVRESRHAVVMAALPAGAHRQASLTHISFNSDAQACACRLLRQEDKRLAILGVVHTHPGSLRHPSGGDYRGDIQWVKQLRGKEGVFAIGTADGSFSASRIARSDAHQLVRGALCFTWYVLAQGDSRYRRIPVELALGADLARPLLPFWPTFELNGAALERLCQQQAGVQMERLEDGSVLSMVIRLAGTKRQLRVLLKEGLIRYYLMEAEAIFEVNPDTKAVDHGVYLILAQLAAKDAEKATFPAS